MNSENGNDGLRQRLAKLVGKEDPFAWAKRKGIPAATFDRMWNQGSVPKVETLAKAIAGETVTLDWLLLGRKPGATPARPIAVADAVASTELRDNAYGLALDEVPRITPAMSPAGVAAFTLSDDPETVYVRLPLYAPRASAGPGLAVQTDALAAHLLFSAEWLWNTLRRPPSQLICMQAQGDSMSPRIQNGDVLIVDTGVDRIKDHGIYCFSYEGDLMVKRLQKSVSSGRLRILSDNENYAPEELPKADAERITVVGLVVWHGGLAR